MRWRTDGMTGSAEIPKGSLPPVQMTSKVRLGWVVAAVGVCLSSADGVASTLRIVGRWDAVVVVNTVEVPFRFEIAQNDRDLMGFFFEGNRKVASTSGRFESGALTLEYDFLNTVLEARIE